MTELAEDFTEIPCEHCVGKGVVECVACKGVGYEVLDPRKNPFGISTFGCVHCNRNGEHDCRRCQGSGVAGLR